MKVITLSNEKGGVGKTTLALHLAAGMAVRGKRVVLIDADAQANATGGLGMAEEPGFYDLLVRDASWNEVLRVLQPETYEPPDLRSRGLLAILPGNGETQLIAQKIDDAYAIFDRLKELEGSVDIVIFDTSPTPSLLHGAIYLATDGIVYPTLCETFSLQGLLKTMRHREQFARNRRNLTGRTIHTLGVVPTMYRATTVEHSENLSELRSKFGSKVWQPLPLRITWSEAATLRRPVFNVAPHSAAAQDAWAVVDHAMAEIVNV
jgi:chromosome partitioning protein